MLSRDATISALKRLMVELKELGQQTSAFNVGDTQKSVSTLKDRLKVIEPWIPLRSKPTYSTPIVTGILVTDLRQEIKGYIAVTDRILTMLQDNEIWELDGLPTQSEEDGREEIMSGLQRKLDGRRIFIIHGRNLKLVEQLRSWLRALGLDPTAFDEIRAGLGGTPTVTDVIIEGMSAAQAVIALFTADEFAALHPGLRYPHDRESDTARWQARPNVLFEAGMAFAFDRHRVTFLVAGATELFSDIAGVHFHRISDDARSRTLFRRTLVEMGCAANESPDHLEAGHFESAIVTPVNASDPFSSRSQDGT